jgi:hypothetical protein
VKCSNIRSLLPVLLEVLAWMERPVGMSSGFQGLVERPEGSLYGVSN